ncbi:hypothetical protein CYMTET_16870 [Cymbomonas tetramitiformis]|uniref:Uncharacterized protein n=1 Tax=Cymbomonas tetramitiformis TaxID=36881 RepID=A0AAE0GBJ5_9CHLO|nr:hypothetical protein CYMTET_16870 [Cymbomonas tetramitiformis]
MLPVGYRDPLGPDAPAVSLLTTRKGGYWSHRLYEYCNALLGQFGEDEIYEEFEECMGKNEGGSCPSFANALCNKACGGSVPDAGDGGLNNSAEPPQPQDHKNANKGSATKKKGKKKKKVKQTEL